MRQYTAECIRACEARIGRLLSCSVLTPGDGGILDVGFFHLTITVVKATLAHRPEKAGDSARR